MSENLYIAIGDYEKNPRFKVTTLGDIWDTETRKFLHQSLTGGKAGRRYPRVFLGYKDHKMIYEYVHRMVAETFLDNHIGDHAVIDHIDNNPLNNYVGNLQFLTQTMNLNKDVNRKGKVYKTLTNLEIRKVKVLYSAGISTTEISKFLDIPYNTVFNICSGRTYKEVPATFEDYETGSHKFIKSSR